MEIGNSKADVMWFLFQEASIQKLLTGLEGYRSENSAKG